MKKIFLLFCLLVASFNILVAQDIGSCLKKGSVCIDSMKVNAPRKGEALLNTLFKPDEAVLNNADSIIEAFDDLPSFGIYKNNYVVTGTALTGSPNEDNSDAKFQISFMQRVTNSVLPFKTYLFITYTQLAIWDIYKESFPFRDINFNPTLGLGKVLVYKNRFLGTIAFQLEHESNGKDGDASRSWNKISFMSLFMFDKHWTFQSKLWIPLVDGQNNRNISSYKGWAHAGLDYKNKRLNLGMLVTKRAGNFFDANVSLNLSYRLFKHENQHLFIEYYNGYGENQLDYNKYKHRIRIGFVIMPGFMRIY